MLKSAGAGCGTRRLKMYEHRGILAQTCALRVDPREQNTGSDRLELAVGSGIVATKFPLYRKWLQLGRRVVSEGVDTGRIHKLQCTDGLQDIGKNSRRIVWRNLVETGSQNSWTSVCQADAAD